MAEPRYSPHDFCPKCSVYRARIEDLEEVNKDHHKLNARLRKVIANLHYWVGTLEKEFNPPETEGYEYR
jgi:hypothetical protein